MGTLRIVSPKLDFVIVSIFFFTSGFTGLVYEVLWMKELGLIFGNTAHAASTTLSAFFIGIGCGSFVLGKFLSRIQKPLRIYAFLEFFVAISALLYFLLSDLYNYLYPILFNTFGSGHWAFLLVKFILALVILFPPAFFMGGTLPAISQYLVRNKSTLGKHVSVIYAINIIGASLGAFVAGFLLPKYFGYTYSYLSAVAITLMVGLFAFLYDYFFKPKDSSTKAEIQSESDSPEAVRIKLSNKSILTLAFISGVVTLGMQVLWTRMFAQVLHNSVYTFSTILIVFLISLSIGSIIARALLARVKQHTTAIFLVITISSLLVVATPYLFIFATDNLSYFGSNQSWIEYTLSVFILIASVTFIPIILLGIVFPYLIKVCESQPLASGQIIGNIASINTIGAVVGSIVAGFIFLEIFGLWTSVKLFSAIYLIVTIVIVLISNIKLFKTILFQAIALVLILITNYSELPLVTLRTVNNVPVELVEVFDGSAATVSVVKRINSLRIKVNNFYSLGGTDARNHEERQAHLPLLMHENPKSVYFLGMGTGITAGAALRHPVESVVVTELIPDVIEASNKYFTGYLNNLFQDKRVSIFAEDGRNYLLGTDERYDVIIADLFVPYKAGTGSLYTQEHYETAKLRLNENGFYAQWLPLFQLSENEFAIIAKTMLQVFPQVTLWRGKFHPTKPIALLVGHTGQAKINLQSVRKRISQIKDNSFTETDSTTIAEGPYPLTTDRLLQYYIGNLSISQNIFEHYPINVDDHPVIEYQAPIAHRQRNAQQEKWFNTSQLIKFYEQVYQTSPSINDPYLINIPKHDHNFVYAGYLMHVYKVLDLGKNEAQKRNILRKYKSIVREDIN